MGRLTVWTILGLMLLAVSLHDVQISAEVVPTESECRPYIDKAINDLKHTDSDGGENESKDTTAEDTGDQNSNLDAADAPAPDSGEDETKVSEIEETQKEDSEEDGQADADGGTDSTEAGAEEAQNDESGETEVQPDANTKDDSKENDDNKTEEDLKTESTEDDVSGDDSNGDDNDGDDDSKPESQEENNDDHDEDSKSEEKEHDEDSKSEEEQHEVEGKSDEEHDNEPDINSEEMQGDEPFKEADDSNENGEKKAEDIVADDSKEDDDDDDKSDEKHKEDDDDVSKEAETTEEDSREHEDDNKTGEESVEGDEKQDTEESSEESTSDRDEKQDTEESTEESTDASKEDDHKSEEDEAESGLEHSKEEVEEDTVQRSKRSLDEAADSSAEDSTDEDTTTEHEGDAVSEEKTVVEKDDVDSSEDATDKVQQEGEHDDSKEGVPDDHTDDEAEDTAENEKANSEDKPEEAATEDSGEKTKPEDDLLLEGEIPETLRDRNHINEILHLDESAVVKETSINRVAEIILRDLKRIYENAIKPLEALYKYRDLSNRHFGDPEIFSKPLVLFMGPWSGGKSTIINYLTENEYNINSLRSGAEPSPAYFNILMHGDQPEVLDGTQLAADWTFSGLQKFGQGLEDRLRGLKLPNKLLEMVNIVEIPGILEVRKQVSRLFPFNDACQWFIDRADIIFLVYDPAKLDVGPETEAILDQLKGREYQTRIILNKADGIKPEELLRVQSALIWNISPLMSSAQPPVMYTTSLWSHPYDSNSPVRLLQAQEKAFLKDLRTAIDKRIENKIASARRFAVRVRNHAKMVDCYLTTYYNHKTLFGNKKRISDEIIENPQNYHIYEGLSTLTNISRYDLPDPEVYRDFFRLNPLYEFKKLSETCTYFRGCPINKLDVAIAYDLPELVGKYKKLVSGIDSPTIADKSKDKS